MYVYTLKSQLIRVGNRGWGGDNFKENFVYENAYIL